MLGRDQSWPGLWDYTGQAEFEKVRYWNKLSKQRAVSKLLDADS